MLPLHVFLLEPMISEDLLRGFTQSFSHFVVAEISSSVLTMFTSGQAISDGFLPIFHRFNAAVATQTAP